MRQTNEIQYFGLFSSYSALFYMHLNYHKNSKNWDMYNNYHSCSKIETILFNSTVIHPKDGDGMANSADPDQTAPFQAV